MPETLAPSVVERKRRELEQATVRFDRREAALQALQEQVRKDGDHLYADAKAKCVAELAQIDQREAALTPKESSLRAREDVVAQREQSIIAREQRTSTTEIEQREARQSLTEQSASIATRLHAVKEREEQHQRLRQADLDVIEQRRKVLQDELSNREARLNESMTLLVSRETELKKREAVIEKSHEKADALLKTAQARDTESQEAERRSLSVQSIREQALSLKGETFSKRTENLEAREKAVDVKEQQCAQQEHDLNRLSKGLNKAKLDIETKEAQVEKRERLVNAIAKRKEVADELAKLE